MSNTQSPHCRCCQGEFQSKKKKKKKNYILNADWAFSSTLNTAHHRGPACKDSIKLTWSLWHAEVHAPGDYTRQSLCIRCHGISIATWQNVWSWSVAYIPCMCKRLQVLCKYRHGAGCVQLLQHVWTWRAFYAYRYNQEYMRTRVGNSRSFCYECCHGRILSSPSPPTSVCTKKGKTFILERWAQTLNTVL